MTNATVTLEHDNDDGEHEAYTVNEPLDLMLVSIASQGSLILLVGRTPAGERYTVQVPFSPYFYVPDAEANDPKWPPSVTRTPGYRSAIDDRSLTRVMVTSPSEVPRRRRGHKHYEADVPYTRRFLIDTGIKKGFRLTQYTVVNERHRVLLVDDLSHITPADVDAPLHGILYDIETRKNPRTGKWDAKPPTNKNVNGAILSVTFNWVSWDKDGAHPHEQVTTYQWRETGQRTGRVGKETHFKYSYAHEKDIRWDVHTFNSESEMLTHFTAHVKHNPPDILAAWNGHYGFKTQKRPGGTGGFDAPYLINRLDAIGIGSQQLSPFNQAYAGFSKRGDGQDFYWKCEIAGIQLVDLMTTYTIKDGGMTGSVARSSLKWVVERKTKMPVVKEPGEIESWWMHHNDAFLDYAFQDVDCLMLLEKKEDYILYIKRFQWTTGVEDANCLFAPSTMIDSLWLRKAREIGVVLPSGGDEEAFLAIEEDERGGYVLAPRRTGLLKNVVHHDFSALYAEILAACNVGRDTLVLDPADYREDDITVPIKDDWSVTVRFRSPDVKRSISSLSLGDLRAMRKVYDDQIALAKTPAEVKKLKKEREPSKQLLLAAWGVIKNKYARLGHEHAGAAIPATGRFLIKSAIRKSDELGSPISYTDTDGATTPSTGDVADASFGDPKPVAFGEHMEKEFASAVDEAARRMNIKTHNFDMGFEKVSYRYVMGRTKKRYAAIVSWSEGTPAPPHGGPECQGLDVDGKPKCVHFEMTGFEAVKHDTAPITKEVEVRVLWGLLHEVPVEKLIAYVRALYDSVRRGEVDPRDVAKAQRLGFDIQHDADTNTDIVRGARNGRDLFGFEYALGARVFTLHTKGNVDVVSVPEDAEIPVDELKVDWEHHAQAAVLKPIKPIFEMVGVDAKDIFASIEKNTRQTKQKRLIVTG